MGDVGSSFIGEGLGGLFLGSAGGIYNAYQVRGFKNTLASRLFLDEGLSERQSLEIASKMTQRLIDKDGDPKTIYSEELGKVKMSNDKHLAMATFLKNGKEMPDEQYNQIAIDSTGKDNVADMNYHEAEIFIKALTETKASDVIPDVKYGVGLPVGGETPEVKANKVGTGNDAIQGNVEGSGVYVDETQKRSYEQGDMSKVATDVDKTTQPATISPVQENEVARDNIAPQDTTEAGKGEIVYHGTNEEFDKFVVGKKTGAQGLTSKYGVWFTSDKEEALQYARLAGKRNYQNQEKVEKKVNSLIRKAEQAASRGDYDSQEKMYAKAEKLESEMRAIKPKEIVKEAILPKNMLIHDSMEVFNSDQMVDVIKKAKQERYDGVKFTNIQDSPYGLERNTTQYIVFSPSKIKYPQPSFNRLAPEAGGQKTY